MVTTQTRARSGVKFTPIYLESIRVDSVLDFDLFIRVNEQLVLYRSSNMPFTERTRQKLMDNRVDRLFITDTNQDNYQKYIEKNLDKILADPTIPEVKKAGILYQTSTNLVKDVLANPTFGENIQRSKDIVANSVNYILQGREAFLNLVKITSFDYYTYTHSVNVCTFSVALAQQLGFNDEEFLNELGTGALLHDVGKSKISDRILNKRSSLNQIEFEIMKKHPQWGVEMLDGHEALYENALYPVLQHHERGDHRGYPAGLSLDEMHIYSRIVAITDSFDAMTTERVYQKAMESFPAMRVLFSRSEGYDDQMLRAFAELMGPTGLTDF